MIQTDNPLDHNKPDIVVHDRKKRECVSIDVACPFDTRVEEKEGNKIEIYQDLKRKIDRLWECRKVVVVPIVIGALGTISKRFMSWADMIGDDGYLEVMQKACLLGTARIIRRVFDMRWA